MKTRIVILCVVVLAGCAGQGTMRRLAGDTAALVNDYGREMAAFAERQNALNADTQRRTEAYDQRRELVDGETRRQLVAWDVAGDKGATDAYRLLASQSAEDIIAQSPLLRAQPAASPAPTIAFDSAAVQRLTRQLNALRRAPSYWERVTRILAYRDELRETYEKSLDQATAETGTAIQAAAEADQQAPAPPGG